MAVATEAVVWSGAKEDCSVAPSQEDSREADLEATAAALVAKVAAC